MRHLSAARIRECLRAIGKYGRLLGTNQTTPDGKFHHRVCMLELNRIRGCGRRCGPA
jgi:hypothetical protein